MHFCGMQTAAAPDPLDAAWPAEDRAAARERVRLAGRQAGLDEWSHVPNEVIGEVRKNAHADKVGNAWVRTHEEYERRVAEILRSPEAVGREPLARQLAFASEHSALAAIIILRGSGTDVGALPVGGARKARLAAIRRAASAHGGL